GLTLLMFPASCAVSCVGAGAYLLQHRQNVEGKVPPDFPVMVVLPAAPAKNERVVAQYAFTLKSGKRAEIIHGSEMEAVLRDYPEATFMVPDEDVQGLNDAMDKIGDGPTFSNLQVRDRGAGREDIDLNASFYDDNGNESWYTASAREIQPHYWHRHGPFLS